MGRRKKDDGTFWLALGLYGAGWVVCKAVKALFSMPKLPNPPVQQRLSNQNDCEAFEFVLGIILMVIVLVFLAILDVSAPCMLLGPIVFSAFFIYRYCKKKKKSKK